MKSVDLYRMLHSHVQTIHDAQSGKIAIYYGCADTYVGLAFTTVEDVAFLY